MPRIPAAPIFPNGEESLFTAKVRDMIPEPDLAGLVIAFGRSLLSDWEQHSIFYKNNDQTFGTCQVPDYPGLYIFLKVQWSPTRVILFGGCYEPSRKKSNEPDYIDFIKALSKNR